MTIWLLANRKYWKINSYLPLQCSNQQIYHVAVAQLRKLDNSYRVIFNKLRHLTCHSGWQEDDSFPMKLCSTETVCFYLLCCSSTCAALSVQVPLTNPCFVGLVLYCKALSTRANINVHTEFPVWWNCMMPKCKFFRNYDEPPCSQQLNILYWASNWLQQTKDGTSCINPQRSLRSFSDVKILQLKNSRTPLL